MSWEHPDDSDVRGWYRALSVRVALFLSLALLPLGLLAVLQTRDLTKEVRSRSELSLLALTENAAAIESQTIERGLGAAEALSAVLRMIRENPEACQTYLQEYLRSTHRYSYVGFVPKDGQVRCASAPEFGDFANDPLFRDIVASPRQVVAPHPVNWSAENSEVVVYNPVYEDEGMIGVTVLTMVAERLMRKEDFAGQRRPLELVTYSAAGRLLTVESLTEAGLAELPSGQDLSRLPSSNMRTFRDRNRDGADRIYIHTEIVPGTAYALGVWDLPESAAAQVGLTIPTSLFPLLMWLASLAVAVFAVHRLVGRPLQELSAGMRRFAIDRKLTDKSRNASRPAEIRQLERSFESMAYALMDDEARMEDALREKNILLKEVHHRVKNNLQMISSIMNMKIRKSQSEETRNAIRRLQERVLGMATVHRGLYQSEDLSKTNVGDLLRELFAQLVAVKKSQSAPRLRVSMDLDDVVMFPDQAVPFALLASEIATNCLNFAASDAGQDPWIKFSLKRQGPEDVMLECRNSVGPGSRLRVDEEEVGLGSQLIKAFTMQLGATHEVKETGCEYISAVSLILQDFRPDAQDY